tara:strand:- start:2321 stop:3940 length:1620 start_codon:yes stop_codon:yes gene_type:complete
MADTAEDTSGYSPLLAQMLKIDPNQIGSVSLSALGRQAMGADSDAYKAAKAEVDAARETMKQALQDRKGRIDPSMLALAQGFLAPTRTGSFGESLGTAAGAFGKAQEAESDRNAQLAKMRYELALKAVDEEKEAARLGLNVVSKLSPKMTAYQQQVQSEGVDPRSPSGISRIKELLAVDKATPEMKAFAAQSGVTLTDPQFAMKFKMYEDTKGLREIATRLNLNLNDPAQLVQAQQEAQRDAYRKENKLVADALQTFGGDPLNPKDLTRAQKIVDENVRLEQTSKRTSIAQQIAQTTRTKQEIDDHIRQGDFNAVAAKAVDVGVPIDPKTSYAGLNKIEAAKKRDHDLNESGRYIREKITPFTSGIEDDIRDLQRALKLNSEISTGYTYGVGFGIGDIAKLSSGDRTKISEFDSLAALAAKQNRIPGDSNVSNLDVKMMQLGTFSSDKEPKTNETLIKFKLAQRERDMQFNKYMADYAAVNGAITPYAEAQWRRYLDANPITSRDEKGKVSINPNRMTYQQYFSMPRVRVDSQGRETPQ